MHCKRRAHEFLHFLLIFAGWPDAPQTIESTPLLNFLHFLHFLLTLPLDCTPGVHPARLNAAGRDDQLQGGSGLAYGRMNDA
jgi:hypothetical protein